MDSSRRNTDSVSVSMEKNSYKPQLLMYQRVTNTVHSSDKFNLSNKINYMLKKNSSLN